MAEVPASDHLISGAVRWGTLLKLCGRGWIFSGSWKKRFCVLTPSALYYYDKEHSSGLEKACGVLNLKYYDVCENDPKRSLTFVLDSSVTAFCDNRHQFCAEKAEEFERWTSDIRTAITKTKAVPGAECLLNANKDRVRGPQGRRPPQRRSLMPATRTEDVVRQRSVSLSSPQKAELPTVTESLSMDEVGTTGDRQSRTTGDRQSRTTDIPREEGPREGGPKNLLLQHSAVTRELEMRLKAGMITKTPCSEVTPAVFEGKRESNEVEEVLQQVKAALQEVEEVKSEYRKAVAEAERTKMEYQRLREECEGVLRRLLTSSIEVSRHSLS